MSTAGGRGKRAFGNALSGNAMTEKKSYMSKPKLDALEGTTGNATWKGEVDEKRATESVCDARARPEAKKRQPQAPRRPSFRSRSRLPSRQLGWVGSGWLAKSHRFFYSIDRGLARVRLRQGTTPCTISAQPKETTPVWAHTSDRTPCRFNNYK